MHEFAYREIVPTLLGRNRPRRLTVPTLMLNSARAGARTARTLRGYEAHADHLRVQMVDGAGHWRPEERAELVAAAVRACMTGAHGRRARCILRATVMIAARWKAHRRE
jgi:pimeloyl-ACP methyl ester carboxylesterase